MSKPSKNDEKNIEKWLDTNVSSPRCLTCRHEGVRTMLRNILETMIRTKKRVRREKIHAKLREEFPDYQAKRDAFNTHLRMCEMELWEKIRNGS